MGQTVCRIPGDPCEQNRAGNGPKVRICLSNPDFADELISIDLSEVAPDDLSLVDKGAVFYWSVGYLDYPGRGRVRESKLRLRRLRGWTKKEIENAKRIGKEFAEFFESNSACSTQV